MNSTARSLASPLANRTYRHLYLGVMTVGLALLAYQLAGDNAGAVLGIALSLRIVAFVLISPLIGAYAPSCRGARCLLRSTSCARPQCCCYPLLMPYGRCMR